jgi:hypothetical protein
VLYSTSGNQGNEWFEEIKASEIKISKIFLFDRHIAQINLIALINKDFNIIFEGIVGKGSDGLLIFLTSKSI